MGVLWQVSLVDKRALLEASCCLAEMAILHSMMPLAEWVADHVNDSGYRELHRYLAADTNQLLADMGCALNDLEVPMRQVLHYQVPMRQVLNASIW